MPKWLVYFLIVLIVVVALFFVVSLVMASFHNVSIVGEWQRWIDAIKPAKEAAKTAVDTTAKIILK